MMLLMLLCRSLVLLLLTLMVGGVYDTVSVIRCASAIIWFVVCVVGVVGCIGVGAGVDVIICHMN